MNETINLVGEVELKLNDVVVISKKNLIVQVGKNFLANAILNASSTPFNAIAIGKGTTAAALTDTALQTEVLRTSFDSASIANNVITLVKNYLPGVATGPISEAGIFNNATSFVFLDYFGTNPYQIRHLFRKRKRQSIGDLPRDNRLFSIIGK